MNIRATVIAQYAGGFHHHEEVVVVGFISEDKAVVVRSDGSFKSIKLSNIAATDPGATGHGGLS
ncbi:MAG: hypothetical protein JKY50_00725 [Oleispira sp.]|nr:hypothetical protein [Oleispira sp.]